MTRKQQIEQAWLHGDAEQLTSFRLGAEWADEHPKNPWIFAYKQLPPKLKPECNYSIECFVYCYDDEGCSWKDTAYYNYKENQWEFENEVSYETVVQYWMPIPETPEEEEE